MARVCTECGNSLQGKSPTAKTCGDKCRAARSRRVKRTNKEHGEAMAAARRATPEQAEIAERVREEAPDVAHKIIEEELRPVVREQITADTIAAIGKMVALTPRAVYALEADLESEDDVTRQRAYTLLLKYTVGHQAIVRPPEEDKSQPITVNFALPRPSSEDQRDFHEVEEPVEADALEVKTCDTCGKEDVENKFAANSTRCLDCYDKQRAKAAKFLGDTEQQ